MTENDPLEPERCSRVLSALASPERLRIVRLLTEGERNVTQIIEALAIPPLNVNHHLKVLVQSDLIRFRKQGRFVIYSLCEGIVGHLEEPQKSRNLLELGCCQLVLPDES